MFGSYGTRSQNNILFAYLPNTLTEFPESIFQETPVLVAEVDFETPVTFIPYKFCHEARNIKTEEEKIKKFLSGFVMVNKSFKQILENNGVTKIEAIGKPFDPAYHQAIETIKVEGVEPNMVVEEIMTGYSYKDRILRPSMVKVSE